MFFELIFFSANYFFDVEVCMLVKWINIRNLLSKIKLFVFDKNSKNMSNILYLLIFCFVVHETKIFLETPLKIPIDFFFFFFFNVDPP